MTPDQLTHLQRAGIALAGVLLLVVGFSAGRFSAPVVVSERVEYKAMAVEDITRGYTFAKKVEVTRWRNVVTQITDAGTTITEQSGEREGALSAATGTEQSNRSQSAETVKDISTVSRPDWRIGAQVGASLREPALVITGPLVLGVTVERRIIGGVSAGLWANTVGAGGASVSVEF